MKEEDENVKKLLADVQRQQEALMKGFDELDAQHRHLWKILNALKESQKKVR